MKTLKTKLRIGKISYINAIPFYHGLGDSEALPLEFYPAYPTKINEAVEKGELDLAPISSLAYLKNQKEYLLLPHLAIGSRDFSGSVLLISREKIENLNGKEIALTPQSLSSVALLKILLKNKFGFTNTFVKLPSTCRPAATLFIGDEALFFKSEEFFYKYDLSELWWNWTAKPFCFALWALRRKFAQSNPEEVSAFVCQLQRQTLSNLLDLEKLIQESLKLSFTEEAFTKVFGYLFNLNYHLDESMKEGLELFFQMASNMNLAPRPGKIEFFEPA